MPLINNPNIYTGGAVVLDSRPHTQLYINLMQREQAKNEAFDNYLRNLNKSINPAGLRNQERPIFEKKLKEWQQFGMNNRDRLRNPRTDGGAASMEFQTRYQDLLNLINESKAEEEKKKPLVEIMVDPDKRERLTEEIIPMVESHDQPIYVVDEQGQTVRNPNRKSFDVSAISFDPKPIDIKKYFDGYNDIKRMELPPVVTKDPKNMTQTIETTAVYSDEAKDVIATRAVLNYANNKSFKKLVDSLNPDDYNEFFKTEYGKDIENSGDLAAAFTLKGLQRNVKTSKLEDDIFARQKEMERIRQANRVGLLNMRASMDKSDKAANDLWIDRYITTLEEDAKEKPTKRSRIDGENVWELDVAVDPVLSKALAKDGQSPDVIRITKDGKFRPIYLKYEDGKPVGKDGNYVIDKLKSVPITKEQMKFALGKQAGVKQTNIEMSNPPEEYELD